MTTKDAMSKVNTAFIKISGALAGKTFVRDFKVYTIVKLEIVFRYPAEEYYICVQALDKAGQVCILDINTGDIVNE